MVESLLYDDKNFMNSTQVTADPDDFGSKKNTLGIFVFAGLEISTTDKGFCFHRRRQTKMLHELSKTSLFKDLEFKLIVCGWITHIRSDILCTISQLAKITGAQRKRSEFWLSLHQ